MPVPDGYSLIPAPTPGPPPGYTLDRTASMAPNQTNPQADTTGGQALGTDIPQTTPPPGAKYKTFTAPAAKVATAPESQAIEAPDIATDFGNQNPKPQAAGSTTRVNQWDAPVIDPQRLQTLARFGMGQGNKPLVEEIRGVIWDKDRKHMREDFLWRDPGGNYRDDQGNKLDPNLVDRRSIGSRSGGNILQRMEIHDPGAPFGHSQAVYNTVTNEWSRPHGDERPMTPTVTRFYGTEGDATVALAASRAYTALEEKRAAEVQGINARYQKDKEYWIQQRSKLNAFNQPMITEQQLRDNISRLDKEYFGKSGYKDQITSRYDSAQRAIERDPYAAIRGATTAAPASQAPPSATAAGAVAPQAQGATTTQGLLDYLQK